MKHSITQPCIVIGSTARATSFADDLARQGVKFVSCAASVGQLRRHLVLGEDASMVLCVLLGVSDLSPADRQRVGQLLADKQGFPTRVLAVGVLHESQSLASVAGLGCDAYVADADSAVEMIRAMAGSTYDEVVTAQQLLRSFTVPTQALASPVSVGGVTSPRRPFRSVSVGLSRARTVESTVEPRGGNRPPT